MSKYIIALMLTFFLGLYSCDDYLDINTDPNNLVSLPNSLALPATQVGTAFFVSSDVFLYTSLWVQHIAGTANEMSERDVYAVSSIDGNVWNQFYQNLVNLDKIEKNALDKGDFIHAGMAQSLKAYLFAVGTDIWNDIPFEEALQGSANLSPAFTEQEAIYDALLQLLDEASVNLALDNAVEPSSAGDLVYNGNADQWLKFVNSLKLKLLLNLKLRKPEVATQGINDLLTDGQLITDLKDDFKVQFSSAITGQNPIYQFQYVTRQPDSGISNRLYSFFADRNDPRMPYFFRLGGVNPSSRTFDNGDGFSAIDNDPNRLRWGEYIVGGATEGDAPVRLLTSSLVHFMLAEAYLTLPGLNGDAEDITYHLTEALMQQMTDVANYTGLGSSFTDDALNFVGEIISRYEQASSEEKLNIVMTEKWASLVGNSYEAYNDFRRTRLPKMLPVSNSAVNYPERLPYSNGEALLNPNFPSSYEFQPADLVEKVWWAK